MFQRILFVLLVTSLLVITGCNILNQKSDGTTNTQQVVADQPLPELTLKELLAKTQAVEKQTPGYQFTMNGTQTFTVPSPNNPESSNTFVRVEQEIQSNGKQKNNPFAIQLEGQIKMNGQSFPLKSYIKDGYRYIYVPNMGWQKEKYQTTDQDMITKFIQDYFNNLSNETPLGLTKKRENGVYQLEMGLEFFQSNPKLFASTKDNLQKMILKDLTKTIPGIQLSKIKIEDYSTSIQYDEKTLQPKQMNLQYQVKVPSPKGEVQFAQDLTYQFQGTYQGEIQIPSDAEPTI